DNTFIPFCIINLGRQPSRENLALAEDWDRRGLELAEGLDDAVLMSAALDGIGDVTSREYPREALTLARRRLSFEHRLNVEERLDAHNVLAWRMCELGVLEDAISTSERGLAALQPGQDTFFALALACWRPYALAI